MPRPERRRAHRHIERLEIVRRSPGGLEVVNDVVFLVSNTFEECACCFQSVGATIGFDFLEKAGRLRQSFIGRRRQERETRFGVSGADSAHGTERQNEIAQRTKFDDEDAPGFLSRIGASTQFNCSSRASKTRL